MELRSKAMRNIGFVISGKENEGRRALLPSDLRRIKNCDRLVFEEGYAVHLGVSDAEYQALGCAVKPKHEVYRCEVVCNPKAPEPAERELFASGQTFFGWLHAVQGREITDFFLQHNMTGIAWEDMFDDGRHCFWKNNEIAGQAAVLHALRYFGRLPEGLRVAIIGMGNCGRGAYNILSRLGAKISVYSRATEKLLRKEVKRFDIVVNAVLWDVTRTDHILYFEDLKRMRPGSMIIDISCDSHMGIESSKSTTIGDPIYMCEEILHYAVDHVPALFPLSATDAISKVVALYVDQIVELNHGICLRNATVIEEGTIRDERILRFQNRALTCRQRKSGHDHDEVRNHSFV